MLRAGLSTSAADTLICPLCWNERPFAAFSPDHFIPKGIGGRLCDVVPTCTPCNNDQGSDLDSQLSGFQDTTDGLNGSRAISTEITVGEWRMVANWTRSPAGHELKVVAKASNPNDIAAIRAAMESQLVKELHLKFRGQYVPNLFNVAMVRAGYLALFAEHGYEYVKRDIVQGLRRRIIEPSTSHPDLSTLIAGFSSFSGPDVPYLIRYGMVGHVPFCLAIIRVRRVNTAHFGVFFPAPSEADKDFFQIMAQHKAENPKEFKLSDVAGLVDH